MRPRAEWGQEVRARAVQVAGNEAILDAAVQDEDKWKILVREYCRIISTEG